MTLPAYAVDFRGFPACPCLAEWLPALEAECQRVGILTGSLHVFQLIGTNPKSGGTHAAGGAFDVHDADGLVWVARQMGADATWRRPFNWDGKGGIEHIHGVLRGCPHNAPARYQITAVDDGFNGLGPGGRGGPDDGPRPLSLRTWREGIAWAEQEADMTPDECRAVVREELRAWSKEAGDLIKVDNPTDPKKPKWSLSTALGSIYKRTGGK